jgi:hypothetical protein
MTDPTIVAEPILQAPAIKIPPLQAMEIFHEHRNSSTINATQLELPPL